MVLKVSFFVLLSFFYACSTTAESCKDLNKSSCSVLKDFTVFDTKQEMHFNHLCSELGYKNEVRQRAYAFFEKNHSDRNYKALLLGEIFVGWVPGPDTYLKGLGLSIEKMQIKSLTDWTGDSFSIALQMQNSRTKKEITGPPSETFFYSEKRNSGSHSYPEDRQYTLSDEGSLDWERFTEPKDKNKKAHKEKYKGSEGIYIDSREATDLEDEHRLSIVLKNTKTGSTIRLQGPALKGLKSLLDVERPVFRTLGFWEAMNPFQKGGLWDWFKTGYRYRNCIYLRKFAKKEFSSRFSQQLSL